MDLVRLYQELLAKAEQPALFAIAAPPRRKAGGRKAQPSRPVPKPKPQAAAQPTLWEAARELPAPKSKPQQPTLWEAAEALPSKPKEKAEKKPTPRDRSHLVPEKRVVERNGKVFVQTYWVAPEEASGEAHPPRTEEAREEPPAPEAPSPWPLEAKQEAPEGKALLRLLRALGVKSLEDDLYVPIRLPGMMRTALEAHEVNGKKLVYLTHYRDLGDGDLAVDTEVVYELSNGQLRPVEVAYTDPFGRERRLSLAEGGAKGIARTMLKNLLEALPQKPEEAPAPPAEAPTEAKEAKKPEEAKETKEPTKPKEAEEAKAPQAPALEGFGFDLVKGAKARRRANEEALALAKRLLEEGRAPTPEEERVLARYTGDGGLDGDLNAHYTPTPLAKSMWALLQRALGRVPERALEPSMGAGVFFFTAPPGVRMEGVELSAATATVAKALWEPKGHAVHNLSFEEWNNGPGQGKTFPAVIANPPYGLRGIYAGKAKPWLKAAEEYFIDASLDRLEDGGVGVFLINPGPVENPTDRDFRLRLMARAHVLGVYQLPQSVFKDSGSGVPPVVLVVRKRPDAVGMTLLRLVRDHGEEALEAAGVLDREFLEGRKHLKPENLLGEWDGESITFKGYKDIKGDLTPELLARLERAPMEPYREADLEALKARYGEAYEEARLWAEHEASDPERGRLAEGTVSADGQYVLRNHRWHRLQDDDPLLAEAVSVSRTLASYANALANGQREDAEVYRKEALAQVEAFLERYGEEGIRRLEAEAKRVHGLAHLLAALEGGRPARYLIEPQLPEDDLQALASREPEEIARGLYARRRLETGLFARLANLSPEEAVRALREMGYAVDESGRWEKEPLFYVGDPLGRAASLEAAAASPATPDYLRPVLREEAEAFRKLARPKRLGEFEVSPREPWVPEQVVQAFLYSLVPDGGLEVRKDPETGYWQVLKWGRDVLKGGGGSKELQDFVRYLNYDTPVERVQNAKDMTAEERRALKQQLIEKARRKEKLYADKFLAWLAENPEHAEEVEEAYNRAHPTYIPEPDREDPVEEKLPRWRGPALHPYQRAAVHHALDRGGSIIALDVGLGKTYTGLALAEALLQEGRAKRVMTVTPRSLLGNWRNAFTELAGARLYLTGEEADLGDDPVAEDAQRVVEALRDGALRTWEELEARTGLPRPRLVEAVRRLRAKDVVRGVPPEDVMIVGETFDEGKRAWIPDDTPTVAKKLARLASDPSIRHVVITRDWFGRIPVREETVMGVVDRDVYFKRLEQEAEQSKKKKKTPRDIAASYAKAYQKAAEKLSGPKVKATYWEDLGVEALISDEHHAFKNLHEAPQGGVFGEEKPKFMGAGAESARAFDMLVKTSHLRAKMGGGGVYAMTATPTKNSPLEVYNMLRYVTDDVTRIAPTVKAFVDRYIKLGPAVVPSVTGGLKQATAVVGWKNLNELRSLLRKWVYRRTAEEVGLEIPEREDRHVTFPLTRDQAAELKRLADELMGALQERDGSKIFSYMAKMRLLTLDPALYHPKFADTPNPRYARAAQIAKEALDEGGKVVMFMDLGRAGASRAEGEEDEAPNAMDMGLEELQDLAKELGLNPKLPEAKLRKAVQEALDKQQAETYERLKAHLVRAGIPEDQIAIVTSRTAASPAARADLEAAYRAGKIRVIIGSTGTIGEGFNLQEDTTDMVHLDLPWDPGTYWQRLGRAVRQGNRRKVVRNHVLMAEGSFDALTFATLKGKQGWTDILWNGHNDTAHNAEAMDTDMENYVQMVAAVAGDPEAAKRFLEEQKAKLAKAEAMAKAEAARRVLKAAYLARRKYQGAYKERTKQRAKEEYEAALREVMAHPDIPERIKAAIREGKDWMPGEKHVHVVGDILAVRKADSAEEPDYYQILHFHHTEGKALLRRIGGDTTNVHLGALEQNDNYIVEAAVPPTNEVYARALAKLIRQREHPGIAFASLSPSRARALANDPEARKILGEAYADFLRGFLERGDNYVPAIVVGPNGLEIHGDKPGEDHSALFERLRRGEVRPLLPIPEDLEAVNRNAPRIRNLYVHRMYLPFRYYGGEWMPFEDNEDRLIKGGDLVRLWYKLVREARDA